MTSGGSSEISKLDVDVVYCSSEDPFFKADEVCRIGSGVNRGWQSAAHAGAPHQLGLRLPGDSFIERLQVISHDCKIASKVEVHVAEPIGSNLKGGKIATFHDAVFRLLGYFAFNRSSDRGGSRCGELKCIAVGCRAIYIKLVFHEPLSHLLNTNNQVGITSVVCMGSTSQANPVMALRSLPTTAASAAEMDMMCDAAILEKIRIFDASKRKAVADEELETARRINQQIDVMIPLAIQTKSLEQQKEFAVVSNDFDKAQKIKAQIQRIRTFVHSLKVGMPLEDFSLERFDEYVSGQIYRSPARAKVNADEVVAVSKAQSEKRPAEKSPMKGTANSMVLVEDDEAPLADDELNEHDMEMKKRVEALMKKSNSVKTVSVEHVSHTRSSRIQGWDDANRAFGLYFACCLFSKNYIARETAVEIILQEGFSPFEELAGGSAPFFCTALGSYLASSSYGPQESVQSTLVANVDLICALAAGSVCGPAGQAALVRVCEDLCSALLHRCADSNKKVKEAASRGLRSLASCPAVGLDRVCSIILEVEVKRNFRILLAKIDFLIGELAQNPDWAELPSFSFSALLTSVLRPAIEGISPEIRGRGAELFAIVLQSLGTTAAEIRKALKALRPSQLAAVEAAYGSKISLDSPPESSPMKYHGTAVSPKRRSIAETLAKEPDLENVYKFNSRTPQPSKKGGNAPSQRSSSVEPAVEPRVTIASNVEHVPSKRASSIKQKLTGAIRDSRKPIRPSRRTQPDPTPGRCQFCHASIKNEEIFDHFISHCPMLCVCPLCRNPVEVIDVHWHLAEDCQFKSQIRQCQTCFNCFKPGEFNQHVAAQSCTPYDHSLIVCPLCQVVLPRDDLFWEDHMLQAPFCEKNPRRPQETQEEIDEPAEDESSSNTVQSTASVPVSSSNSTAAQAAPEAVADKQPPAVSSPNLDSSASPASAAFSPTTGDGAAKEQPPAAITASDSKREWFHRRPAFVARRIHKKTNPDLTTIAPDEFTSLEDLIDAVHTIEERIHSVSEIGSPSDDDLARMDTLKQELASSKRQIISLLQPLQEADEQVEPNQVEYVTEFFECLVKDTDIPPANRELLDSLITAVFAPWADVIAEKELILVAATDGSLDYFSSLLAVPGVTFDVAEVLTACIFNLSVRMELAWVFFKFADLKAHCNDEIKSLMQDFFEGVASKKRAIPKERREKREDLLRLMVASYGDMLHFDTEGSDCQTVFTRALAEGDVFVTTLLMQTCAGRLGDINMIKTDKTTPLMQAVFGNSPEIVKLLLETYGDTLNRSVPDSSNGFTDVLQMAIALNRDAKIIDLLKPAAPAPVAHQPSLVEEID